MSRILLGSFSDVEALPCNLPIWRSLKHGEDDERERDDHETEQMGDDSARKGEPLPSSTR